MKIPLNVNRGMPRDYYADHGKINDQDVLACRQDDWEAKNRILNAFAPLLSSLARERTKDPAMINKYIEAGKEGLFAAVRKYKPAGSGDRFQIFALAFIEKAMDGVVKRKSFFARLFSR